MKTAIITISTSVGGGRSEDSSSELLAELTTAAGAEIVAHDGWTLWRVDSLKTRTRIVAQTARPGDENFCVAGCTTKAAERRCRAAR